MSRARAVLRAPAGAPCFVQLRLREQKETVTGVNEEARRQGEGQGGGVGADRRRPALLGLPGDGLAEGQAEVEHRRRNPRQQTEEQPLGEAPRSRFLAADRCGPPGGLCQRPRAAQRTRPTITVASPRRSQKARPEVNCSGCSTARGTSAAQCGREGDDDGEGQRRPHPHDAQAEQDRPDPPAGPEQRRHQKGAGRHGGVDFQRPGHVQGHERPGHDDHANDGVEQPGLFPGPAAHELLRYGEAAAHHAGGRHQQQADPVIRHEKPFRRRPAVPRHAPAAFPARERRWSRNRTVSETLSHSLQCSQSTQTYSIPNQPP